jgi:hypothetical protein
MKAEVIGAASLLVLAATASWAYPGPLHATLPKEQDMVLSCGVDDALMVKDCAPQFPLPALAPSALVKRTQAFIELEKAIPEHLAGATPGSRVLVMIRRSLAAPLDEANPGRAVAPASPSTPPVVGPLWSVMPSSGDMSGYFPDRALRTATSGTATARCTVGPKGDLLGCWVAAEAPAEMGFAPAILKLSTFLQMKPEAKDGSATAGRAYAIQAAFDARTGKITLSDAQ